MLIIFSGLPGVGKSTIARELSKRLKAVYLRADTIEQTMRTCMPEYKITCEGYVIAYAIAAENLASGMRVVADSVNPFAVTRDAWKGVAAGQDTGFLEIEIICSDNAEHRRRIAERANDIPGLKLPTWDEVVARVYEPWTREHFVIDTAVSDILTSVEAIEGVIELIEKGVRVEVAKAFCQSRKKYERLYQKLGE